jgi:hypothetical protein
MTDDKLPDIAHPKLPKADDRIRGKLKLSLDLMVFGGEDGLPLSFDVAARSVNFPVRSMRRALERPHVRRYLKACGQVMRASICARIPHRLGQLMMQDENRAAAVRAAAVLETIDERESARPPGVPIQPGLTIIVLPAPDRTTRQPPIVDVTPNPGLDIRGSDDEND